MPIYEYCCSSCGHELEALQKFSDAPLVTCPACGAAALVKQVSAAGFQLKGSGWYVTDFRGGAKPGKTEGGATTESTKGADTPAGGDAKESKGDGATAAKSETKSESKSSETSSSATPASKTGTTATP
jgi:putative FmdB family regulatory protein